MDAGPEAHATSMVRFTVPLPPKGASPNGAHGSWVVAGRVRALYREEVGWLAQCARPVDWGPPAMVRVSLAFGTKGKRGDGRYHPFDVPNAVSAFKAGFDGLVDAGLAQDDDWRHLELGRTTIDPRMGPGVEVTIEECYSIMGPEQAR